MMMLLLILIIQNEYPEIEASSSFVMTEVQEVEEEEEKRCTSHKVS
jgi:hypothetical protein